jgi:hypothetical protein
MIGLGTMINVAGILVGGVFGLLFGRLMNERLRIALTQSCGIAVLFLGIGGTMEKMLTIEDGALSSGGTVMMIVCLALGTLVGAIIDLDRRMEQFGEWLKRKTGNANEQGFVAAFVTASLTVCIGAMAIVGAIQDGIFGDWSTLAVKALLDLIIILLLTSSLGKGCIFSAIPVALVQGSVTLLARLIEPIMTDAALSNLSLVGSILIFCVGINLIWDNKIKVANMLPSIVVAVVWAFLPI